MISRATVFLVAILILALKLLLLPRTHTNDNQYKNYLTEPSIPERRKLQPDEQFATGPLNQRPVLKSPVSAAKSFNRIKLLALFQTHDTDLASAVILIDKVGAYRYRTNSYIDKEMILLQILQDRIVIDKNGEIFEVKISPPGGSSAPVVDIVNDSDHIEGQPASEADRVSSIRQSVLEQADLTPLLEGSASGYIVGDRFPLETTRATGVQPGDIIISVNGYSVGEIESDLIAWSSMQQFTTSIISVQRENEQFEVRYP